MYPWGNAESECIIQCTHLERSTKQTHSELPTVELSTYLSIAHFNDGSSATIENVYEEMGTHLGRFCKRSHKKLDISRIHNSIVKSSDTAKKWRKAMQNREKGFSDALEEAEGP